MKFYVDGIEKQYAKAKLDWRVDKTFKVPQSSQIIGIECADFGGEKGIIASVEDTYGKTIIITDSSWKCSSSEQTGWTKVDFHMNPKLWSDAEEVATHGSPPWGKIGKISDEAKWIWVADQPTRYGKAYCRIRTYDQGEHITHIPV